MQITGYTTQSSLIRLWTYTSSLFSLPNPVLEMPQKEKGVMDLGNSYTDWEILSRRVVFGFQCAQQIAARERGQATTGERLEWSVLVSPSPCCPGVDHWRQENSNVHSQGGTGACPHPLGWRDREAPGKVKAFGGALVDRWVEAISGELVGQEGTSSPDHNSRDLLLWRTLSLPLPRLTMRGPS